MFDLRDTIMICYILILSMNFLYGRLFLSLH